MAGEIRYTLCTWQGCPPFYVAVEARDAYTETIEHGTTADQALLYIIAALNGGGSLIDLGSNIGAYSFAAAAGGSRVLAVEALAANYSLLVRAICRNQFTRVTAVHAAIFRE